MADKIDIDDPDAVIAAADRVADAGAAASGVLLRVAGGLRSGGHSELDRALKSEVSQPACDAIEEFAPTMAARPEQLRGQVAAAMRELADADIGAARSMRHAARESI
ncbi:hypothetical protein [Nocardia yamanashiensis]|uniref:hypothetical protein n=1 Tax=Nocardia yamanashiensis TaxID=209247 RepID=UPI0008343EFF|nr:hypothetical protein [Nocardia yamanashiensis]